MMKCAYDDLHNTQSQRCTRSCTNNWHMHARRAILLSQLLPARAQMASVCVIVRYLLM